MQLGFGAGIIAVFFFHVSLDANLHFSYPVTKDLKIEHLLNIGATGAQGYSYANQRFSTTVVLPLYRQAEIRLGFGAQTETHKGYSKSGRYNYVADSLGLETGFHYNWEIEKLHIQIRALSIFLPLVFLKREESRFGDYAKHFYDTPRFPTVDLLNFSLVIPL